MLGITIHWTVLVVRREPQIQIYYMDSMNYPLKDVMEENYNQLDNKDREYRLQVAYFKDLKRSVNILLDLLLTDKDVGTIKFEGQLTEMLDCFDQFKSSEGRIKQWVRD